MDGEQNTLQTNVRLPLSLKEWLQRRAKRNRRSMTSELIGLLESVQAKENAPTAATVDASMQ